MVDGGKWAVAERGSWKRDQSCGNSNLILARLVKQNAYVFRSKGRLAYDF